LPQFTYDGASNEATVIVGSTPVQSCCSGVARYLVGCFSASGATSPGFLMTTKSFGTITGLSPVITLFLNTQKAGGRTEKGYYGDMSFLDTQEAFNLTFGDNPIILPSSPTSTGSESCYSMIREYCDLCKLSIFMHLCRLNYVGNAMVDVGLNTLKGCSQITALRQVYSTNGCTTHDTPDKMFDKFSQLALSLPDK